MSLCTQDPALCTHCLANQGQANEPQPLWLFPWDSSLSPNPVSPEAARPRAGHTGRASCQHVPTPLPAPLSGSSPTSSPTISCFYGKLIPLLPAPGQRPALLPRDATGAALGGHRAGCQRVPAWETPATSQWLEQWDGEHSSFGDGCLLPPQRPGTPLFSAPTTSRLQQAHTEMARPCRGRRTGMPTHISRKSTHVPITGGRSHIHHNISPGTARARDGACKRCPNTLRSPPAPTGTPGRCGTRGAEEAKG